MHVLSFRKVMVLDEFIWTRYTPSCSSRSQGGVDGLVFTQQGVCEISSIETFIILRYL
jgi:hypothetical protein